MEQNLSSALHQSQRVRHPLKIRSVQVTAIENLTPHMRRFMLSGDDLADFISLGFDDHCKLFFPDSLTGELQLPVVSENGLSDGVRPPMRDYTPRYYDNQQQTLVIDFVLHETGIATQWASQAKIGDKLGIGGPRGSFIIPMDFDGYVLIGDETALPAIARRLEELPTDVPTLVIVEVADKVDEIQLQQHDKTQILWLHRQGQPAGTADLLLSAIDTARFPVGDTHVWVAAETGVARKIRDKLYAMPKLNKEYIKVAGYWQHEKTGEQEKL